MSQHNQVQRQGESTVVARDAAKQPFVEPKLTFVEPQLEKRGNFADLTEGFFGGFTPS